MPLALNWASTCRNQTVGSVGQKGGNLMLTAATNGGEVAGVAAAVWSLSDRSRVGGSVVAIVVSSSVSGSPM